MKEDMIAQTTLDQMVGSDEMQMLKAAIPYLPAKGQQVIYLYTKIYELANTARLFSPGNHSMHICASSSGAAPLEMFNDIRQFCYGKSRRQLDQIVNAFAMMEMIQVMQQEPPQEGGNIHE